MKIIEFLKNVSGEITFSIRCLCGKPSPVKRFIIVAVVGIIMGIASVSMLVSSVYRIGYTNAQKEIPAINTVRQLNLKSDSINLLKQQIYEYEHEQ